MWLSNASSEPLSPAAFSLAMRTTVASVVAQRWNARLAIDRARVWITFAMFSKFGHFRSLHDAPERPNELDTALFKNMPLPFLQVNVAKILCERCW